MARSGSTAGRVTWADKTFRSDVRPHMRNLAEALQLLCRHLVARQSGTGKRTGRRLTQAKAAERIHCCESSLSRYLSGQSMPHLQIIEKLYLEASRDAGGEHRVETTLDALTLLHKEAEAERHRLGDEELAAEVDAMAEQLKAVDAERTALRKEVAGLKTAVEELKASEAGLRARLAAQTAPGPLPVPRRRGDRQRMRRDIAAVRNLAVRAAELDAGGRAEAALRLLRRSADEVLNPLETAGLLLLLRQQQHNDLADNLIHVYGRDQGREDVLNVALSLHEQGAPDDAGAVLHAALD